MKKHGVYDNSSDLVVCSELLSKYKQAQNEIEAITSKNSSNTHSFTKTYPLAYNAYNLDEDSPSKKKNKGNKSSASGHDELLKDEEKNARTSPQATEKEKEDIVKKIFGS